MFRIKGLIIFTVLVDIIGVGIVIPSLPYYVTSFGARPLTVTLLFTAYSFFSFFSAPFLGAISDRYGRRPVLIASILSTSLGWFVFAAAHSIAILFLGRIIDGLAAGNISTAQSSLVDIAKTDKERTSNLGIIGAAFGVGFIVGPLLGGLIGHFSPSAPFWFAGGLALLNAILAIFMLPETNFKRNISQKLRFDPFLPVVNAFKDSNLRPAYLVWFLFGLGAMSVNSVFALYLNAQFALGALAAGLTMGGIGVIVSFNQAVALKHFWLKYFKEPDLELTLLLIFAVSYLLMCFPFIAMYFLGIVLSAFAQSILRVVITSQVVGSAGEHSRGEVLGILTSTMSIAMIIGPAVAGVVFEYRINGPYMIGAMYMFAAFVVAYYRRKRLALMTPVIDPSTNTISIDL